MFYLDGTKTFNILMAKSNMQDEWITQFRQSQQCSKDLEPMMKKAWSILCWWILAPFWSIKHQDRSKVHLLLVNISRWNDIFTTFGRIYYPSMKSFLCLTSFCEASRPATHHQEPAWQKRITLSWQDFLNDIAGEHTAADMFHIMMESQ